MGADAKSHAQLQFKYGDENPREWVRKPHAVLPQDSPDVSARLFHMKYPKIFQEITHTGDFFYSAKKIELATMKNDVKPLLCV